MKYPWWCWLFGGSFVAAFALGATSVLVSTLSAETHNDIEEWQAVFPRQRQNLESALGLIRTHRLLATQQTLDGEDAPGEAAKQAVGVSIPGGGVLLGIVQQGDARLALVQSGSQAAESIVEVAIGELLPGGQRLLEVNEGDITIAVGDDVQHIFLYPPDGH